MNAGDAFVGMTVPGELGESVVLAVDLGEWNFSRKPNVRLTLRELSEGIVYSRLYSPDDVLCVADDAAFRRWASAPAGHRLNSPEFQDSSIAGLSGVNS